MADMSEPDGRGAALLALRRLAEAHGGMAAVAMEAGIQRESLYRALSPNVAQRQPHHEYLDRRPEIPRHAPDGGARQESGLTYLAPGTR